MATLAATAVGNAAAPNNWTSAPNGALTLIGDASQDTNNGNVTTNSGGTNTYSQGWELGALPGDFGSILTCTVQLRYAWQTGTQVNTWTTLAARIMSGATVLAAADSGGTLKTVASSITTTTNTNSSTITFDYVNTAGTPSEWDAAVVEIGITIVRSKGGDSLEKRVFACTIAGTYTVAAPTTRGRPFGQRGNAFGGGRTFLGIIDG